MSEATDQLRGDDLASPRYEVIWDRPRAKRWAICVFVINEGEKIRKQLAAMSAHASIVDVIVADGGSSDGSLDGALIESTGAKALLVKRGPGKLSAQMRMAFHYCLSEGYDGVVVIDGNAGSLTGAAFRGFEAEGAWKALRWGDGETLSLEGAVDYVHARISGIGAAPRIPPLRVRGGLNYDAERFSANAEAVYNARQNRVASNEIPVDAFTLVNASLTWRPGGKQGLAAVILSGENLLDANGRLSTSETRDFVPIAGRNLRVTLSLKI